MFVDVGDVGDVGVFGKHWSALVNMSRWAAIQTSLDSVALVTKLDDMFNCAVKVVAQRRTSMLANGMLVVFDNADDSLDAWLAGSGGIANIDLVDAGDRFGWPAKYSQREAANKHTPMWLMVSMNSTCQSNHTNHTNQINQINTNPTMMPMLSDQVSSHPMTKLFAMLDQNNQHKQHNQHYQNNQNKQHKQFHPDVPNTPISVAMQNLNVLHHADTCILCGVHLCVASPTSITVQQSLDVLSAQHGVRLCVI
jgi:hypothetical protein